MVHRLLIILALATCAHVANAQEVTATSRSLGMGDALTGGTGGSAAIFHNPAGIASAIMYTAEAGYAYDGRTGSNGITALILDMKSNPHFGMALGFTYELGSLDDAPDRQAYHVRGAIGVPLAEGLIKLGGTLRYSNVTLDGEESLAALSIDAGVIIQPLEWLSFGVTGLNLVNGGYETELPRQVAAGFAISSLQYAFHVSGDVMFNVSAPDPAAARTWRLGAEYLIGGIVPLRAGFTHDELPAESTLSAGVGYRDEQSSVGLDAAYRHNLDDSQDKTFLGSLSVYF